MTHDDFVTHIRQGGTIGELLILLESASRLTLSRSNADDNAASDNQPTETLCTLERHQKEALLRGVRHQPL